MTGHRPILVSWGTVLLFSFRVLHRFCYMMKHGTMFIKLFVLFICDITSMAYSQIFMTLIRTI